MLDYSELKQQYPNNQYLQNDIALCNYLLQSCVAVIPSEQFGIENAVRICYACSKQELETGLTLIKEAIDKIN